MKQGAIASEITDLDGIKRIEYYAELTEDELADLLDDAGIDYEYIASTSVYNIVFLKLYADWKSSTTRDDELRQKVRQLKDRINSGAVVYVMETTMTGKGVLIFSVLTTYKVSRARRVSE